MSNSSLVTYTRLSPNHSGKRKHAVDRISPHCIVGQLSVEALGDIFASRARKASSNYGIGADGRIGMYVEEQNRSWCSSNAENDQRAVTIECASDANPPYEFKQIVYDRLVELCVDICKSNDKAKLLWLGDKVKSLNYIPARDEMVLTVHRFFANKDCPGDWMFSRMGELARAVSEQLRAVPIFYRVRKSWDKPKTQIAAFTKLTNAKNCVDCNPGYAVFTDTGEKVYPQ